MSPSFAWPFRTTIPLRFRDLDCMAHVNNAVYATLLEQARTDCYLALTGRTDPTHRSEGLDFVVARAEIDYLAPMRHGDALEVEVRPVQLGRSSFTLAYEGRRRDGVLATRGRTVCVAYDFTTEQKKPVPPAVAERLRAGLPREAVSP